MEHCLPIFLRCLEFYEMKSLTFASVHEGLQADHTIHVVRGSAPPGPKPSADTSPYGNLNTTPVVTQGVVAGERGGTGGAGLGAHVLPGLGFDPLGSGGASGLFGAGLPNFEQMQEQLSQSPNMMRELMNMPAVQNLMNNPDLIRNLIMNNPQMREIIDRNPDLGHILNDPGILRQTLEVTRNPELMREMMRNTDRAMSNIESSPEGFNMLRRMYENVQEPLLNATASSGGTGNNQGFNPFAALLANQGNDATQRREGSNTTTTGSETISSTATPNSNPLPNPWSGSGNSDFLNFSFEILFSVFSIILLFDLRTEITIRNNFHVCLIGFYSKYA